MKVLFVDDDLKLLDSLRRMALSKEDVEAFFAHGGMEALDQLAQQRFDIVVADMLMPGMDGASLLEIVQELYPETVRIILSGHSDQDMILRSVKPAHQFLSKPCAFDEIMKVLERLYGLRSILTNPAIFSLVSRIDMLPSLPQLYLELMRELDSDQRSLAKLGKIIAKDMGLSGSILKVVNSSFFGLPRSISSPQQAVTYLGEDLLRGLVLSYKLVSALKTNHPSFHAPLLWNHGLNTAFLCRALCHEAFLDASDDDGFNAGLLHDLGKLILLNTLPKEFDEILELAQSTNQGLAVAEKQILGVTHAELGAYLLGLWGFPSALVTAVAGHHEPRDYAGQSSLLPVLHAANVFEHQLVVIHPDRHILSLDMEFMADQGLADSVDRLRDICQAVLESGS